MMTFVHPVCVAQKICRGQAAKGIPSNLTPNPFEGRGTIVEAYFDE
jgi:hypothetical protein